MTSTRVCGVKGCDRPHDSKGYCSKHYQRLTKYGDPLGRHPRKADWIRERVNHVGRDCLVWPFSFLGSKWNEGGGYGQVAVNGKKMGAHRYMCILAHGSPPKEDAQAAHSCNNSRCVNPHHLRWASPMENTQDKISSGYTGFGEQNPVSKIGESQVREILASGDTNTALAAHYGVSHQLVSLIRKGKRWPHVYQDVKRVEARYLERENAA